MRAMYHAQQRRKCHGMGLEQIFDQRLRRNMFEKRFNAEHQQSLLNLNHISGLRAVFVALQVAQQLERHERIMLDDVRNRMRRQLFIVCAQRRQITGGMLQYGQFTLAKLVHPFIQRLVILHWSPSLSNHYRHTTQSL